MSGAALTDAHDLIHVTIYRDGHKYLMRSQAELHKRHSCEPLSSPQHSSPVSVSPFQTDAQAIVFLSLLFRETTRSHCQLASLAASSFHPCHSIPSLPLAGMHFSHSFSLSPPGRGALGCPRALCVWLSQIYSSYPLKGDTSTSSVCSGLHPTPLSSGSQRSRTCDGRGK